MKKTRIDELIFEKGLAPSVEKAAALVMAGIVFAGDEKIEKPGQMVAPQISIEVRGSDNPFVGRGGLKLAHALKEFGVDPKNKICMDVGASTGGFTDCLIQKGAQKVYAIDVGYGQLAQKVARDERVVVIDRTNIRTMDEVKVPEKIDIAVVDVSFISLLVVFPAIKKFLKEGAQVVALIKPQFEAARGEVGKGGIVRDAAVHELVKEKIKNCATGLGWKFIGVTDSPILGAKGNKEFLMCFEKS